MACALASPRSISPRNRLAKWVRPLAVTAIASAAGFVMAAAPVPQKAYSLFDDKPAPLDLKGWESHSFPLGNGHFGVSFFGGVGEELWQFTEKSLFVLDPKKPAKAWDAVGLSSLCELRVSQDHDPAKTANYRRELDLVKAMGTVTYELDGVRYLRETFTSYPDKCFAARITASKPGKVSFRLKALHSYLGESRTGTATVEGNSLVLRGDTLPYHLKYEVRITVQTKGGRLQNSATATEGEVAVEGADEAVVLVSLGTNYRLEPSVFLTGNPGEKLGTNEVPSAEIAKTLATARAAGWNALRERHQADVGRLFQRTQIDLGGVAPAMPTDRLLSDRSPSPAAARYLEELYFQFGRYLLIGSSRKGTLPANLQGTWNMNQNAPWTGGYWANINIQMNYWPAFSTGLEETFSPYYDLFHAMFPRQQVVAASTLKNWGCKPVEGAWTAGTGNSPFTVGGPGSTSGAGTGPFVILPLWDWYAYTGRKDVLEKMWPFLLGSSRFLSSALKEQPDGTLLCDPSWSPENMKDGQHVTLPGSAYDQQLAYENHRMTLQVAKLLNISDPILPALEAQLPRLSPVLVGTSGQIKEFRQENAYGEFGEYHHRHISQLIGLYPGTVLTEKNEWLDASKVSLNLRGDQSTGWAMAHRLNAWTRVKDGNRCHALLQTLLHKGTLPNLWDTHPPFQIDGNFGGTSGIAEMLLQSHGGFIELLPALPDAWATGSFSGIRARGLFSVSAAWKDRTLTRADIRSEGGTVCRIRKTAASKWRITGPGGKPTPTAEKNDGTILEFQTVPGQSYAVTPATARAN